jgi:hypothetical protein
VSGENSNTARIAYIRNIRIIAGAVLLAAILGAGILIYVFGLRAHPRRLGLGFLIAGIYVVVGLGGYAVACRQQIAAARRM